MGEIKEGRYIGSLQDEVVIKRRGNYERIFVNGNEITSVVDYNIYKSALYPTEITLTIRANVRIVEE